MNNLTLQLNIESQWLDAAFLLFDGHHSRIEYDLEFALKYLGSRGECSLGINFPVGLESFEGRMPGFILDLIPQGEPLKRLLARYQIKNQENYFEILTKIPLSPPGNIRVKEAWTEMDEIKKYYDHPGFQLEEIIKFDKNFVTYMEEHGAPVGGTSGAGGGSPKFLLRLDYHNRFHAEGMLQDEKTLYCYLVKFPFTDSENSLQLTKTEKIYYSLARELPVLTGEKIEIHNSILFIKRFDRNKSAEKIAYLGLESLYSAHNISYHGKRLMHEDNLELFNRHSTAPEIDIIEYVKRDLLNVIFANTDNHGRNTSLLKFNSQIRLAPIYDLTAMRFFTSDFIVELTRWGEEHFRFESRYRWIIDKLKVNNQLFCHEMKKFYDAVKNIEEKMKINQINSQFIEFSKSDRDQIIEELKNFTENHP